MSDWTEVPLSALTDFRKGVKVDVYEGERPDAAPYLGASALEGEANQWASVRGAVMAEPTDVLMLWDGERSGLVSGGKAGVVASTVSRLRPKPGVDHSFLKHALQAKFDWIQARRTGTGVPHVPKDLPTWLRVRLPVDRTDQAKIASTLDALDTRIACTRSTVEKLRSLREGLIKDLLSRGVNSGGRLRATLSVDGVKDSPFGLIPASWDVDNCANLCRKISVGIVIRPTQYYRTSGIPVLRSANVRAEGLELEDLVYMSPEDHRRMRNSSVLPGDLVTVRTGYPGTTAMVPDGLAEANCVDIIITRPGPRVLAEYLALWVNSDFGKGQVLRVQGGLAQQHFNVAEMKSLLVAVPLIDEQRAIVETVRSVSERIANVSEEASKLVALKQGLRSDLLKGDVHAPSEALA